MQGYLWYTFRIFFPSLKKTLQRIDRIKFSNWHFKGLWKRSSNVGGWMFLSLKFDFWRIFKCDPLLKNLRYLGLLKVVGETGGCTVWFRYNFFEKTKTQKLKKAGRRIENYWFGFEIWAFENNQKRPIFGNFENSNWHCQQRGEGGWKVAQRLTFYSRIIY